MKANGYVSMVERIISRRLDNPAFSDYQGDTLTFREVGQQIFKYQSLFDKLDIKKGDKIAIIGQNTANWASIYISIITYGATIVPILPDFHPNDVHHIINHSESVLLFTSRSNFEKLDATKLQNLKGVICIDDFSLLVDNTENLQGYIDEVSALPKDNFDVETLKFPEIGAEELMILSYTSGTSGNSKGVLLPHRSIWSNVQYAIDKMEMYEGNKVLSFLPLAHSYGSLFEFLWPFIEGVHITFLSRMPSPNVLVEAFGKVKPHLVLSVPLILEKIFKKRIQPTLEKPAINLLTKIPGINNIIFSKIKKSLVQTFGSDFREIVIGGAPLNKDVEQFLRKIKFPITVGYGMTECGPLISYESWHETKAESAGRVVHRMEVRIDSKDPQNIVGEIQVRGDNVHLGYFKNEKATKESFTKDGWLRTGDLGIIDSDNLIFIKGRSKNMILSGSGQNIYPEEIEAVINSKEVVSECVVRENDGKIEALIYPDSEVCQFCKLEGEEFEKALIELRNEINNDLPAYMHIAKITIVKEEFEKTPKKSIKRYKYMS